MEARAMHAQKTVPAVSTGRSSGGMSLCSRDFLLDAISVVDKKLALQGWADDEARALANEGRDDELPSGVYSGTITNVVEDRYESVVHSDGIDTSNYEKNPVVYLEHGHRVGALPIGRCIALVKQPTSIEAAFVLATGDVEAERAANLINQKVLRSLSIYWRTRDTHFETSTEIGSDGASDPRRILHYDKTELLEFSPVGIPGNQTCTDLVANSATGAQRYATPADEARALSARLYEMATREKIDLATMRRACTRVLSLYGLTTDDAEIAQRAIDFQLSFADLIDRQPPKSLQRALLCEALCACINSPRETPDPVTAGSAVEGAR